MLPVTFALYAAAVALIIAKITAGWDHRDIVALFLLAAVSHSRLLHPAAQRGAPADPLRQLPGHDPAGRLLLGQPVLRERRRRRRPVATRGARSAKPAQSERHLPRYKISLRARTLNGEKLKVNDRAGNPVEIAAVVVWHVADTARAVFDVDDYEGYVSMQSETALRHLATAYAYDHGEGEETTITLRGNVDEVSQALKEELQERLAKAGVEIDESRLTHLAYAPEIAQAMLRRQQAEAIIAARSKIVEGAVGMVDRALYLLSEKNLVQLDEERKAAMVSNLMVVLCGEQQVNPIVNAGTLYSVSAPHYDRGEQRPRPGCPVSAPHPGCAATPAAVATPRR